MNFVDVAIIAFIIFSLYDGGKRGLLALVADLISLALSIFIALQLYVPFAPSLSRVFNIPEHGAKILTFFVISLGVGYLLSLLLRRLLNLVPTIIRDSLPDKIAGSVFGGVKGLLYVGILLLLLSTLPVVAPIKEQVSDSRLAPPITTQAKVMAAKVEGFFKGNFGALVEDTFALITIKPGEAGLDLGFQTTRVRVDERAENEMLRLLNEERTSRGLVALKMDPKLREAARAHSRDMFARGYFAHETPEGKTPAQRLDDRGINYRIMGENLALAPDVALAHNGLMNSPSHRDNILFDDYRQVGIGAIHGGIYGIMFSQEFTD